MKLPYLSSHGADGLQLTHSHKADPLLCKPLSRSVSKVGTGETPSHFFFILSICFVLKSLLKDAIGDWSRESDTKFLHFTFSPAVQSPHDDGVSVSLPWWHLVAQSLSCSSVDGYTKPHTSVTRWAQECSPFYRQGTEVLWHLCFLRNSPENQMAPLVEVQMPSWSPCAVEGVSVHLLVSPALLAQQNGAFFPISWLFLLLWTRRCQRCPPHPQCASARCRLRSQRRWGCSLTSGMHLAVSGRAPRTHTAVTQPSLRQAILHQVSVCFSLVSVPRLVEW